jgi:DNA-binding transcriptional LysR family regulator
MRRPEDGDQSCLETSIIIAVNIQNMDMNLFVVLEAVLAERSATRAAMRLHVTQSAVSNALGRLRRIFDDPLVTRTRGGLLPTPLALELEPQLKAALAMLETLSQKAVRFDLLTTTRQWRMSFAEHYGPLLLPPLMARLGKVAPRAALHVVTVDQMLATDALATGEVDLHLGVPGKRAPAWHSERLFEDELVCILRKGHPAARKPLTVEAFVALPQIQGRVLVARGREVDDALARLQRGRSVVLSVPYFGAIFPVVASSDCVATVSLRQAEHFAKVLPLRIMKHPLTLPKVEVSLNWHQRVNADPAVAALRRLVAEVLAER